MSDILHTNTYLLSDFKLKILEKLLISIRMLKICCDSICKPLKMIFGQALVTGCFLLNEKKEMTKEMISEISKIIVQFV